MSNNKQSSVEWLVKKFAKYYAIHQLEDEIEQAKAMQQEQAQQYAEFCVVSDRQDLPLLDFNSWIAHNETFNTKEK